MSRKIIEKILEQDNKITREIEAMYNTDTFRNPPVVKFHDLPSDDKLLIVKDRIIAIIETYFEEADEMEELQKTDYMWRGYDRIFLELYKEAQRLKNTWNPILRMMQRLERTDK